MMMNCIQKKLFVLFCSIISIQCNTKEDQPIIESISEDFPYESKYIDILDSKMHYVDKGEGDIFLFIHGNPMSMYYWRNVMPHIEKKGRVIAIDLIGMGKSDKPDIAYTFLDHATYVEAFIQKMNLTNVTIIGHDWGSGLELYYATRHRDNIKGLVFMEAVLGEDEWSDYEEERKNTLQFLRSEEGKGVMLQENVVVNPGIQDDVLRPLTTKELTTYTTPYAIPKSRYLIWKWVTEIPVSGAPAEMSTVVNNYMSILSNWDVPKLLLYATPGTIYTPKQAQTIAKTLPNCASVNVGPGLHYLAEDEPHAIGKAIVNWYETIK